MCTRFALVVTVLALLAEAKLGARAEEVRLVAVPFAWQCPADTVGPRRLVAAQIELQRAFIASLERRMKELEPLSRWKTGHPLLHTQENLVLSLAEARLSLKLLESQRVNLDRWGQTGVAAFVLPPSNSGFAK